MTESVVRTRFAPSPTGALHIGGVRTALFSWLYARRHGGQYILRIEDTDRERSTEESVQGILHALDWLGLDADEGPYFQSRRLERYRQVADQLLARNLAYRCYCTPDELTAMRTEQMACGQKPRYDGRCRDRSVFPQAQQYALRFRQSGEGQTIVDDVVHGPVVFENSELDDLVILRSDGSPTYHFGVVVDDADMRITHVIRGDDHLNNTPRHINLFNALGLPPPRYAHIPMIAGPDGAKLSKRHGAVNVLEYRDQGYLPEALLNYLVRLGWSHGDQELFSREQMIALFDLAAVQKSVARFDAEKLNWINQQYIKSVPTERIAAVLQQQLATAGVPTTASPSEMERLADAFRERAKTIAEMAERVRPYLNDSVTYEPKAARKFLVPENAGVLADLRAALGDVVDWTEGALQAGVEAVAARGGIGLGKVAQPLRVAVVGDTASPGIGVTLALLGRDRTLTRIERALALIAAPQP